MKDLARHRTMTEPKVMAQSAKEYITFIEKRVNDTAY